MLTVKRLNAFALASMLLGAAAGCTTTPVATATEAELCRAWRDSLVTRSGLDTPETQAEIGVSYDVQAAACPGWARFP